MHYEFFVNYSSRILFEFLSRILFEYMANSCAVWAYYLALRVLASVTRHKRVELQKVRKMARAGTDDRAIALCRGEIRCLFMLRRRFQRIQSDYSFLMHDSYIYLYLRLRGKPLFSPASMEFDKFNSLSFLAFAIGNHVSAP